MEIPKEIQRLKKKTTTSKIISILFFVASLFFLLPMIFDRTFFLTPSLLAAILILFGAAFQIPVVRNNITLKKIRKDYPKISDEQYKKWISFKF